MTPQRRSVRILTLLLVLLPCGAVAEPPATILFSDVFKQASLGSAVIVQTGASTTLVIDQGVYNLAGRDLLIYANKVVLRGTPKIISYDQASVGPPVGGTPATQPEASGYDAQCLDNRLHNSGLHNGCGGIPGIKGLPGGTGNPGTRGSRLVLSIKAISGDVGAVLDISDAGQTGGKGQTGGQGGKGAAGQRGDDQKEFPKCDGPYAGGGGGQGGWRGAGGQGGAGGKGGTVLVSANIKALLDAKSTLLLLSVAGGAGGSDGDLGQPGVGGDPGPRGSGAHLCTGGSGPNPAPTGPIGPDTHDPTPASHRGDDGQIILLK